MTAHAHEFLLGVTWVLLVTAFSFIAARVPAQSARCARATKGAALILSLAAFGCALSALFC